MSKADRASRRRPHVAVVLLYGPEARAVIYSGLLERMLDHYTVTLFTSNPDSLAFQDLPTPALLAVLPPVQEPRYLLRMRYRVLQIQRGWVARSGLQQWSHRLSSIWGSGRGDKVYRTVSMRSILKLAVLVERAVGSLLGTNSVWRRILRDKEIDLVLTSFYSTPRAIALLQTAHNEGIRSIVLCNSWKDIFVQSHFPVVPTRCLLTSDLEVDELSVRNPLFPRERVRSVGSLHLHALEKASPLARAPFCKRVGLDPRRPFFCYTAAAPDAVVGEEMVVARLVEAIRSGKVVGRPQLLLRLNPMEDGSRFRQLPGQDDELMIQRPVWEWEAESNWCCCLPDDVELWASTIFHSVANISIPSTVTQEFLAMGRPVINVAFDLPEMLPMESSNRRFWDADFYHQFTAHGSVFRADSIELAVASLNRILDARDADTSAVAENAAATRPLGKIIACMDEALT